jgi:outer membrane protein
MIRNKFIVTLAIMLTLSFSASAQLKLSLEAAKELLIKNNTNLKQADLREKIARIEVDQAYDALIPNLGFSLSNQNIMGLNFDQVTGQLITGNQWSHNANSSINSNIILFQGFRGLHTIRLNKINADLNKLDTEKLKYELELQLINLFYQSLINHDLYKVSQEQIKLSSQLVQSEETKIIYGKSTILDVAQAKSKLANDQLNETNARNAYELTIFKLKQILEIDEKIEVEVLKPTQGNVSTQFLDPYEVSINDPYIRIINRRIDQSVVNTKLAKAGYFPTISFNTGYGTNYSSQRFESAYSRQVMPVLDQINNNRSLYLNFTLSYAIFDGFKTKRNIVKSSIATENLQLEREKITRDRLQNYQQILLELKAAYEEKKAIESTYLISKMNYDAMQERFNVGKSSSIDLFKALTDFNMNEFRKITTMYNVLLKEGILKLQLEY